MEKTEELRKYIASICANPNVVPNWWLSEEYLGMLDNTFYYEDDCKYFGIKDAATGGWLFPPLIHPWGNAMWEGSDYHYSFASPWCITDLRPTYKIPKGDGFVDFNFIYDPKDFENLEGSQWSVFRKNIRKWPKRAYEKDQATMYVPIYQAGEQVKNLLLKWAERHKDIYDPELLTDFVLHGEKRSGLYLDNELVGINVWDENPRFINYRYCIDNGSPFLQEYLRYKFYTEWRIQIRNKLVNDGGCLGSESLYKFKMKLNPIAIYTIWSSLKE